jgi:hypothetical protein
MGADVEDALDHVNVPSYVIDRAGAVRWMNEAGGRDLALLLGEAQQLLPELDMPTLVFVLDGRSYVLEPAELVYERAGKSRQAA